MTVELSVREKRIVAGHLLTMIWGMRESDPALPQCVELRRRLIEDACGEEDWQQLSRLLHSSYLDLCSRCAAPRSREALLCQRICLSAEEIACRCAGAFTAQRQRAQGEDSAGEQADGAPSSVRAS